MLIIHLLTDFNGGIGTVVKNLISLQSEDNKVVVFYANGEHPINNQIDFYKISQKKITGFNILFGFNKQFIKKVLSLYKDYEDKIYHFHNFDTLGFFSIYSFSKKSLITLHGIRISSRNIIRDYIYKILIYFFLYFLNFFNFKISFVSLNTKLYFTNIFNLKKSLISIIYNGLPSSKKNSKTTTKFGIGFISDLSINKGFNLIVDVIKIINSTYKVNDFHFYIAGLNKSNIEIPNYQNLTYYGYKKNIIYDISENINVIVLPSVSEGLPMILLESISLGIPIIASRVGGIPEICIDNSNGFLIDRKVNNIIDSIMDLYSKPHLQKKFSKNSISHFKKNFQITSSIKLYNDLYSKVLKA